jgi:hypothetical protein
MKTIDIPKGYATIMHQIEEAGEEDFDNLVETLGGDRRRLMDVLSSLRHKGLVIFHYSRWGLWLQLSAKGKKLVKIVWPDLPYIKYS